LCAPQERPLPLKSLGILLHAACLIPETPLVSFQTILQVGGKQAASFTDDSARTPLHMAVLEGAADMRPEIIQLLVEVAPEATRQRDAEGLLPIEILTQKILMKEERQRYVQPHRISASAARLEANWQCAYMLVRASMSSSSPTTCEQSPLEHQAVTDGVDGAEEEGAENDDNGEGSNDTAILPVTRPRQLMLHACLKPNDMSIPLALIKRAMKRYPDELSVVDELDGGNLPLHLIAQQADADDTDDLLGEILNAYPPAACVRNRDGATPLDLAIQSGRQWETSIGTLLQANPNALWESTVYDIFDNLHPLVFATLLRHDAASLVFGMLRAKPGLVRCHYH
jgi:ankyrin repeat protein